MSRTFEVRPYDIECKRLIYRNPKFTFEPGLTVLIGCNGAGKTTLMQRMGEILHDEGIPVESLMKRELGRIIDGQAFFGSTEAAAHQLWSNWQSEGEAAKSDFGFLLKRISNLVVHTESECKERWVLIDGIDSSMSIDVLCEIRGLFDVILETAPSYVEVYLAVSTNQYELAHGNTCIRVTDGEVSIPTSYEDYRDSVLMSAKHKEAVKEISHAEWDEKYERLRDRTYTS